MDLPRIPLFKNAFNHMQIHQVALNELFKKYIGVFMRNNVKRGSRYFRICYLPRFLIITINRFNKNAFFLEKNHCIVEFPEKNFPLVSAIPVPDHICCHWYKLVASITHTGDVNSGVYKV